MKAAATILSAATLAQAATLGPRADCPSWPGWSNIKTLFTFGDSYSQTGFNVSLAQPTPANPMGNPPYPGWTSSNGPNWVGALTVKYNASLLMNYNLAFGGATVDPKLAKSYVPNVHSLIDQVEKDWTPNYAKPSAKYAKNWEARSMLVGVWMGVNDVMGTHGNNYDTVLPKIIAVYKDLMNKVRL